MSYGIMHSISSVFQHFNIDSEKYLSVHDSIHVLGVVRPIPDKVVIDVYTFRWDPARLEEPATVVV